MAEVGMSLGSNLGERLAHLQEARERLRRVDPGARLLAQSPVYETEPVGVRPEHAALRYLNAVLVFESELPAGEWLHAIHGLERDMGRVRGADRNAPRPIDVDILYCGDACLESNMLIVPHPRWAQRRFVVQPLADVRPDLVLPEAAQSVRAILAALADPPAGIRLFAREW